MNNLRRYTIWFLIITIFASYSMFLKSANDLIKEYQLSMGEVDNYMIRKAQASELPLEEELDEEPTTYTVTVENTTPRVTEPNSVEDKIRAVAKKKDFNDVDRLVAIAKCESSLKWQCGVLNHPDCVNTHNNSFDRGYFQISKLWHPEVSDEDAFDVEKATEHAIRIYKKSGNNFGQWACNSLISK